MFCCKRVHSSWLIFCCKRVHSAWLIFCCKKVYSAWLIKIHSAWLISCFWIPLPCCRSSSTCFQLWIHENIKIISVFMNTNMDKPTNPPARPSPWPARPSPPASPATSPRRPPPSPASPPPAGPPTPRSDPCSECPVGMCSANHLPWKWSCHWSTFWLYLSPGDCVLGPSVLLEEGIGEAAVKMSQEPFRFENQSSLPEIQEWSRCPLNIQLHYYCQYWIADNI